MSAATLERIRPYLELLLAKAGTAEGPMLKTPIDIRRVIRSE